MTGKEQNMANKIRINELPTRTWNRLNVNSAEIEWDEAKTVLLEDDDFSVEKGENATYDLSLSNSEESFGKRRLKFSLDEESSALIFENCSCKSCLDSELEFELSQNSSVKLVQFLNPVGGGLLRHRIVAKCQKNSKLEVLSVMLGDGDNYADNLVELFGDNSSFETQIAYLGQGERTTDINIVVNHYGKATKSEIGVSGALTDSAKKTFRGSIDFKKGSSDSVGSENETVLMLGENVVNKTVPLILCAEENVDGSHGATIGELDDDTLFYFESRGIEKAQAERMLARAAIERIARISENESFSKLVTDELERVLKEQDGEE